MTILDTFEVPTKQEDYRCGCGRTYSRYKHYSLRKDKQGYYLCPCNLRRFKFKSKPLLV